MSDRKKLLQLLTELSEEQEQIDISYIHDAEAYWKSLTVDQQMFCFYAVVRTIADS
jgi:hypothetical protein